MAIFEHFLKEKIMNDSTYQGTDLGVSRMSNMDLENIALNNAGIIGTIDNKYRHPQSIPYRQDWRFLWIATEASGKKRTLILKPRSNIAREITYRGIVNFLTNHCNADYHSSASLATIALATDYGCEPAVLECVIKTYDNPCWCQYPGQGYGVNYWRLHIECLKPFAYLTVPRLEAVHVLVKQYRSILKHRESFLIE